MRRIIVLTLLIPLLIKAQELKSFGGVWIGQTTYKDGETPSLNVGSFFLAKAPLLQNLYFGYAVSANTNIIIGNIFEADLYGNFVVENYTEVGVHAPFEFNLAYVLDLRKFKGWAGGGLNVSVAQATANLSFLTTYLGNVYMCSAKATGETKFTPGFQIFGGGEYVFGRMPMIGGKWGFFGQWKYMYVKKVSMDISGSVECYSSSGGTYTYHISDSVDIELTNTSVVFGLTYHF